MGVVVVGGGIVGASAAYHLAGRGVDVTVVDGGHEGQATAAGAGIVCPWVDHESDEGWYTLARSGAAYYDELAGVLGDGYARTGALVVADRAEDLQKTAGLLAGRRGAAPEMGEVTFVERPAVPVLDRGLVALQVPGAARVDGRAVRDALLGQAVRRGARVVRGQASLTPEGEVVLTSRDEVALTSQDRVTLTSQDGVALTSQDGVALDGWESRENDTARPTADSGTLLECDVVVVAAGAWTGEVCRPLGVELDVRPRRGQIVHLKLPTADTAKWPIILPEAGPYMVGFANGRLVVGATVEEAGFDSRVTAAGLTQVLNGALRLAPGLAEATVLETRAGLRPVYGENRPLIAKISNRVVAVTGLSSYGLTAGPYAGLLAATLAIGERPPIDPEPYRI